MWTLIERLIVYWQLAGVNTTFNEAFELLNAVRPDFIAPDGGLCR